MQFREERTKMKKGRRKDSKEETLTRTKLISVNISSTTAKSLEV
jgi:hypothetical protein